MTNLYHLFKASLTVSCCRELVASRTLLLYSIIVSTCVIFELLLLLSYSRIRFCEHYLLWSHICVFTGCPDTGMAFVHNIRVVVRTGFCSSHHIRCFVRRCPTTVPSSADTARTSLVWCAYAVTVTVAALDVARWVRAPSVGVLWDFLTHRFVWENLENMACIKLINKVAVGEQLGTTGNWQLAPARLRKGTGKWKDNPILLGC
jgi:hypothetical protein